MQPPHCNAFEWEGLLERGAIPVFLIRHGQTSWNKERRFLGRSDVPLDEDGHAQAGLLTDALSAIPLEAVYSSPLARAWATAVRLAAPHGLKPGALPGLTELDQGELEGMKGADLPDRYPDFYQAWRADPTHARVPGGETLAECQARAVSSVLSTLAQRTTRGPVAIVSHKVAISGVLCDTIGLPPRFNMMIGQKNTAINLLSYKDGQLQLHRLNEATHLDR
jgi:broad specificity phosphatase PhoE